MKSPVLVVPAACAQTENARISGRVTDLTGAVIVGAEWEITNMSTNYKFSCSARSTNRLLGRHAACQLSCCKTKHEPRNPGHQQVHPYEYPNCPRRTRRPVEPDETAQQERD